MAMAAAAYKWLFVSSVICGIWQLFSLWRVVCWWQSDVTMEVTMGALCVYKRQHSSVSTWWLSSGDIFCHDRRNVGMVPSCISLSSVWKPSYSAYMPHYSLRNILTYKHDMFIFWPEAVDMTVSIMGETCKHLSNTLQWQQPASSNWNVIPSNPWSLKL